MTGIEAVVGTFFSLWKSADSLELPEKFKVISSSGKNLMGIALVPYIPDNLVFGKIQRMKKRNGQLHHTKIRGEMPPIFRHFFNDKATQFFRKNLLFFEGEFSDILRPVNIFQYHSFIHPLFLRMRISLTFFFRQGTP